MYEVEVKAKLRNRNEVFEKLKSFGCTFSEELHQIDYIFIPHDSGFPPILGVPVLRVRKQNDEYFFTLKVPQSSRQDCIERELKIEDGEKMLEILRLLGWKPVPTVNKKRIKTLYRDMEIVLDDVEGLGDFIEAEKIVENADPESRKQTQAELFTFLETLGVQKDEQIMDGKYDIMLYEKYGMQ